MGGAVENSNVPFLSTIEGEYKLNMETAKAIENDAKFNAKQRRVQADRLMGEQVAGFGMSGVELEGTPMELIKFDLAEAEQEAMNIIYSGKLQSNQIKRRASLQRTQAYTNMAKDGLMLAMVSGAFSGGGSGDATFMKDGGGFDARSTGTNGYTFSGNSSTGRFSGEAIA